MRFHQRSCRNLAVILSDVVRKLHCRRSRSSSLSIHWNDNKKIVTDSFVLLRGSKQSFWIVWSHGRTTPQTTNRKWNDIRTIYMDIFRLNLFSVRVTPSLLMGSLRYKNTFYNERRRLEKIFANNVDIKVALFFWVLHKI